tara:strand:- start:4799 stop:5806 length:1008 start_codon:yes stop_codon:yes gene_type:complete
MASKARQLAQSASAPEGRKNIITNGAMQAAQRSTSVAGIGATNGAAYHTVDRFNVSLSGLADGSNSGGRLTMSQDSDSPDGFANSVKFACTTAQTTLDAGDFVWFNTRLEGQDLQRFAKGTSSAKNFTLSFYVKANSARTMVAELFDSDNTRAVSRTFTTTTGWSRIEIDFGADTTGAFDDDGNLSLYAAIWLAAGSTYSSGTLQTSWVSSTVANRAAGSSNFLSSTDNTLFITGMQLEVGSVATEFEHRSFTEELALCKRYYHALSTDRTLYASDYGSHSFARLAAPTTMRAVPTVTATASSTVIGTYHTHDMIQLYLNGNAANASSAKLDAEL